MPLRGQELVELCRTCKRPAEHACLRCGTPLCIEHAPIGDDDRCERCEQEWESKTRKLRAAAGGDIHAEIGRPTVAVIWALILSVVCLNGVLQGEVIGGLASALLVSPIGVAWYLATSPRKHAARRILRKKRQRFLAKRARRLPELPPAPPTD